MEIRVGNCVEVCSKQEGFVGSYYKAKVVATKGPNQFLVEYTTLFKNEDGKELLMEIVDASEIRPLPPLVDVSEFKMFDVVDAFDLDGWWIGKVSSKIGPNRYCVYFDIYGVELPYSASGLRRHQEYENGKWLHC